MAAGRVIASLAAAAAVAGCIALAAEMGGAADSAPAAGHPSASYAIPPRVIRPSVPAAAALVSTPHHTQPATLAAAAASSAPPPPPSTHRAATGPVTHAVTRPVTHRASPPATHAATPAAPAAPATYAAATQHPATTEPAARRGVALPLHYRTGRATRVITVTATSRRRTTARLQAWRKAPGGGWLKYGRGVTAHIGAQGMTTSPSESKSATPMGSFTLTHAFGRRADPGTALPYFRTTPADWWISQPGPLYNTHQRCASHCAFTRGAPNEHLYYETPYYDYAVVIDYNVRHVRQGAGSAFFLHVYPSGTGPTAGCVAIPRAKLVSLMRWLRPATHPRILIGVR